VISRRQARWSRIVLAYDCVIQNLVAIKTSAGGIPRQPNFLICYGWPRVREIETALVEPHDDLMPPNIAAQHSNILAVKVSAKLFNKPMIDCTDPAKEESQLRVSSGTLMYEGRIYVPVVDFQHSKVISLFHDKPEISHLAALITSELGATECYWPEMDSDLHNYVSDCELCH
jgi:hypothetical protein